MTAPSPRLFDSDAAVRRIGEGLLAGTLNGAAFGRDVVDFNHDDTSTADTGHFYVTKKNARTMTEKFAIKKYDPVARKHVEYKEAKIK